MDQEKVFDAEVVDDALHAVQEGTMPAILKMYGAGLLVAMLLTLVTYTLKFVAGGGLTSVINPGDFN
jgi:hypothetical protein